MSTSDRKGQDRRPRRLHLSKAVGVELNTMTFAQLFEDHLKFAVRLKSGAPLGSGETVVPTVALLSAKLDAVEREESFQQSLRDLDETALSRAKYAVDALIDSAARQRFGQSAWSSRTGDAHVGHNFYSNFIKVRNGKQGDRKDLLELYGLCELLGIEGGDSNLRTTEDTRCSLDEAASNSRSTRFDVCWSNTGTPGSDPAIRAAHRRGFGLAMAAAALFLIFLFVVYGIAWIRFPRI
jgi:type VI protein secretion system component VasF